MKKMICLIMALMLLLVPAVLSAQEGIHEPGTEIEQPEVKEAGQGTGQGQQAETQEQEMAQQGEAQETGNTTREQNRERLQTGLENALNQVQNENARQRLQLNIEKFQEQYQNRFQNMEEVGISEVDEETGAVMVKAKEQVKYLGFIRGKATKRFEINNNGEITEKQPWYRFLYSEIDSE